MESSFLLQCDALHAVMTCVVAILFVCLSHFMFVSKQPIWTEMVFEKEAAVALHCVMKEFRSPQ